MIRLLNDVPWLIIKDFNIPRSNDETSGAPRPETWIDEFNGILEELHLIEVPIQGRNFTCSNGRP
jgi:hypothetical protein